MSGLQGRSGPQPHLLRSSLLPSQRCSLHHQMIRMESSLQLAAPLWLPARSSLYTCHSLTVPAVQSLPSGPACTRPSPREVLWFRCCNSHRLDWQPSPRTGRSQHAPTSHLPQSHSSPRLSPCSLTPLPLPPTIPGRTSSPPYQSSS